MRYDKLLPRKRKLIPKSIIKTARLVRESLKEQDEYLRKRRMKEKGFWFILDKARNIWGYMSCFGCMPSQRPCPIHKIK